MSQNEKIPFPNLKINLHNKCLEATFGFRVFSIGTYSLFEGAMLGSSVQLDVEQAREIRDFLTKQLELCDE